MNLRGYHQPTRNLLIIKIIGGLLVIVLVVILVHDMLTSKIR